MRISSTKDGRRPSDIGIQVRVSNYFKRLLSKAMVVSVEESQNKSGEVRYDVWMTTRHKDKPWCRYADDGVAHCKTEAEAKQLLAELQQRFMECKLELHPDKTKIVYCKDGKRKCEYPNTKFNFLGYEFRRRMVKGKDKRMFLSFGPGICKEAKKAICKTIRRTGVRSRSEVSIEKVAKWLNIQ